MEIAHLEIHHQAQLRSMMAKHKRLRREIAEEIRLARIAIEKGQEFISLAKITEAAELAKGKKMIEKQTETVSMQALAYQIREELKPVTKLFDSLEKDNEV